VFQRNYQSAAIMISLYGPRNAVRAAWAHFSSGQKAHQRSLEIDGETVPPDENAHYVTLRSVLHDEAMLHMVILHPLATHQTSPSLPVFFQVGEDAEAQRRFYWRLNRACPVPFRASWQTVLWRLGREASLIEAVGGFGLPCYRVQAGDAWAEVVKAGIVSGELK
jgi:hypothetical protein